MRAEGEQHIGKGVARGVGDVRRALDRVDVDGGVARQVGVGGGVIAGDAEDQVAVEADLDAGRARRGLVLVAGEVGPLVAVATLEGAHGEGGDGARRAGRLAGGAEAHGAARSAAPARPAGARRSRRLSSEPVKPPVTADTRPGCTAMVSGAMTMLAMYSATISKPRLVRCRPSGPISIPAEEDYWCPRRTGSRCGWKTGTYHAREPVLGEIRLDLLAQLELIEQEEADARLRIGQELRLHPAEESRAERIGNGGITPGDGNQGQAGQPAEAGKDERPAAGIDQAVDLCHGHCRCGLSCERRDVRCSPGAG